MKFVGIGLLATQHNYMTSAALEITSENSISKVLFHFKYMKIMKFQDFR